MPNQVTPVLNNGVPLNVPTADGTSGQVMTTDGAGNLSFATIGPSAGTVVLKTAIDCSTNPNYPAAVASGEAHLVSVAGKIGGSAGLSVEIGDTIIALAINAGGSQAAVGASWNILEHNLVAALQAQNNLSELLSVATARTNLGIGDYQFLQAMVLAGAH